MIKLNKKNNNMTDNTNESLLNEVELSELCKQIENIVTMVVKSDPTSTKAEKLFTFKDLMEMLQEMTYSKDGEQTAFSKEFVEESMSYLGVENSRTIIRSIDDLEKIFAEIDNTLSPKISETINVIRSENAIKIKKEAEEVLKIKTPEEFKELLPRISTKLAKFDHLGEYDEENGTYKVKKADLNDNSMFEQVIKDKAKKRINKEKENPVKFNDISDNNSSTSEKIKEEVVKESNPNKDSDMASEVSSLMEGYQKKQDEKDKEQDIEAQKNKEKAIRAAATAEANRPSDDVSVITDILGLGSVVNNMWNRGEKLFTANPESSAIKEAKSFDKFTNKSIKQIDKLSSRVKGNVDTLISGADSKGNALEKGQIDKIQQSVARDIVDLEVSGNELNAAIEVSKTELPSKTKLKAHKTLAELDLLKEHIDSNSENENIKDMAENMRELLQKLLKILSSFFSRGKENNREKDSEMAM